LRATPEKYDVLAEVELEARSDAVEDDTAGGVSKAKKDEPANIFWGPTRLLKRPAWAAPILSHGLLYVRGKDRLVCLELIPLEKLQPKQPAK
jgi:hypothetical protein